MALQKCTYKVHRTKPRSEKSLTIRVQIMLLYMVGRNLIHTSLVRIGACLSVFISELNEKRFCFDTQQKNSPFHV